MNEGFSNLSKKKPIIFNILRKINSSIVYAKYPDFFFQNI
jgi:hypothetical protein